MVANGLHQSELYYLIKATLWHVIVLEIALIKTLKGIVLAIKYQYFNSNYHHYKTTWSVSVCMYT